MRLTSVLVTLPLSLAIPFDLFNSLQERDSLSTRDFDERAESNEPVLIGERDLSILERDDSWSGHSIEKRRGGGGGGGRGGGGGSSSGSSSGGSRGSGGSSSAPRPGSTSSRPSYAGGTTFAGGSSASYVAGARRGNIAPVFLLGGVGLGLAAATYPYGYYNYRFDNRYNETNGTIPVNCYCERYNPCGCDDTGNQTTIREALRNDDAEIRTVNGTRAVFIDGTLPNGTDSGAASLVQELHSQGNYLAMSAIIFAAVWGL